METFFPTRKYLLFSLLESREESRLFLREKLIWVKFSSFASTKKKVQITYFECGKSIHMKLQRLNK